MPSVGADDLVAAEDLRRRFVATIAELGIATGRPLAMLHLVKLVDRLNRRPRAVQQGATE